MTTIILVVIGILAVGLGVFSWRFENCGNDVAKEPDVPEDVEERKEDE